MPHTPQTLLIFMLRAQRKTTSIIRPIGTTARIYIRLEKWRGSFENKLELSWKCNEMEWNKIKRRKKIVIASKWSPKNNKKFPNPIFLRMFVIYTYDSLLPFDFKLHTFHILTRSLPLFLSRSKSHSSLEQRQQQKQRIHSIFKYSNTRIKR